MALTIDFQPILDAADLYRRADKELRKELNKATREQGNPWLRDAIRGNAVGRQSVKLANTARLRGGSNPAVVVGSSGKIGRMPSRELVRQYEFGGDRNYQHTYNTRTQKYWFKRHTQRQLPWFNEQGRFVYPSVAQVAPQIVSMWLGILTSTYREAASG